MPKDLTNTYDRNPWIFNCANGEIHAFFFTYGRNMRTPPEKGYIPEYNVYLHIKNGQKEQLTPRYNLTN